MKFTMREITLTGIFAAITVIFAQISIPIAFSPVNITLSILAVFLSGAILGSKCGALSQLVYILLGAFGVPVFSGFKGGIDVITGPKGGYILSYIIIAFVVGLLVERKKQISMTDFIGILTIGLIICYVIGAAWLGFVLGYDVRKSIEIGVAPFLPLDIGKVILASVIGYQVRKALIKANLIQG